MNVNRGAWVILCMFQLKIRNFCKGKKIYMKKRDLGCT